MARVFGGVAGAFAWLGWLSVSPAFGFPSLGPAAMFNRILAPRADSGYWLGWTALSLGLAAVVVAYLAAARRGVWPAGVVSGLAYGVACWLIVGGAVMPLLGLADPFPVPGPPAVPDPMHGTAMMLHLGVGAPVTALVGWVLFGAVVGASAIWRPALSREAWGSLVGAAAAIVIGVGVVSAIPNIPPPGESAARVLSMGPVNALPEGPSFISVFRLPQPAGATLGPHAHVPGFAWSVRGVETMTFADAPQLRVGPGQAGFMGAQQSHTHLNTDDRVPAAGIAVLIAATAAVVAGAGTRSVHPGVMPAALLALLGLGALAVWNPWSNDWLFISVRPAGARGGAMPLPTASRVCESADLRGMPSGPYIETVRELTVAPGRETTLEAGAARLLYVISGEARVRRAGDAATTLRVNECGMVQPDAAAELSTTGDRAVRVLEFSVARRP